MMHGCSAGSFRELTRVFRDGTLAGSSDRVLLKRFVTRHDDVAFETLLYRHGPLVWNICSKLLHDAHEVEDAFQATFLVLVRKAGSLRFDEPLAPWISTVAYRVAGERGSVVSSEMPGNAQVGNFSTSSAWRLDRFRNVSPDLRGTGSPSRAVTPADCLLLSRRDDA